MSADRTKFIILTIGIVALAGLFALRSGMFGNNATETPAIQDVAELPTGDANLLTDGSEDVTGDSETTDSAETGSEMSEGSEGTTEDTVDSAETNTEETVQGGSTEGEAVDGSEEITDSTDSEMAEGETETDENPEASLEVAESVVTNAVISFDDAGNQLLTVSGTADARCQTVRFLLDGSPFGETPLDADGTWAITGAEVPAEGTYESQIECITADGAALSTPRPFMVGQPGLIEPEEAAEEGTEESAGEESAETTGDSDAADAGETAVDTEEAATETADGEADSGEAASEESTSEESAETNPDPDTPAGAPTLTLVNNMEDWIGGPLWVSGEADPFTLIDVVFTNGETTIQDTVSANDSGVWNYRTSLVDPGTWDISAAISGEGSTEPQEVVVVPDDIEFGSSGDCRGKVPPFGTIEGDEYIVAPCEYFSVIFVRLGVSYSQLLNANSQLFNLDNLRAGDRLNIPPFP